VKWWSIVTQLNRPIRQQAKRALVGLSLLLLLGVLVSCALADNKTLSTPGEDPQAFAADQLSQMYARSGLSAIVGLSSMPTLAVASAESTGPQLIGYSAGGLPIKRYSYGTGPIRVAFVGGIHGGTEWNTILLAYAAIDYFERYPERIPSNITLQIVPSANPDGQRLVTGSWGRFQPERIGAVMAEARFNTNNVDLNRNWDCEWTETALWGNREISAGSAPFSEPETRALRDFFLGNGNPVQAVIFWHSVVPGVFAGGCNDIYPAAERLATIYAQAAGYPHGESFTYYPITGDATNWLSLQKIPAIIVELRTRDDPEWSENLAGMFAALDHVAGRDEVAIDASDPEISTQRRFAP